MTRFCGRRDLCRHVVVPMMISMLFCSAAPAPSHAADLDFQNTPVGMVLEGLCRQHGYNLILNGEITGTVSVHLSDMGIEEALKNLALGTSLSYTLSEKTLIVSGITLDSRLLRVNYVDARAIRDALTKMLTPAGRIEAFTGEAPGVEIGSGNSLLITDVPGQLDRLVALARELDKAPAQVIIEARIVETTLGKDEQLGIDWNLSIGASGASIPTTFPFPKGSTGGDFRPTVNSQGQTTGGTVTTPEFPAGESFPYAQRSDYVFGRLNASQLSATLDLISTRSNTNLVSAPKVTTLDGRTAEILVGLEIPVALYERQRETGILEIIGYDQQKVGMSLKVTPRVSSDGRILIRVRPEISEIVEYRGQFNERPVTATRQADVEMIIMDGETLVLGGMIKDLTIETESKVPILGDIPLLGRLFRHKGTTKEKVDLMVFVTPRIVSAGDR